MLGEPSQFCGEPSTLIDFWEQGTGEQSQFGRTGNTKKSNFCFWGTGEQRDLFQGNMYPLGPRPSRLCVESC